ncbi:uncharacterized protein ATNIH1004_008183 [Aspergillus tanneri]|uniref:Terpene cyclase n=1 Tax=Aspergillus tanneri TaxID=1220188 RepID=A0A5M9MMN1_9EURO|nr:uncharacterized protein ATNIH1004_008183 [Aspergillus tanneri]KAA8643987.1 hypothetical protein ATNIH1004_008183 [Aspergillus tanneri]
MAGTTEIHSLFAERKYACLDYYDVSVLSKAQKVTIVEEMSNILHAFLKYIGHSHEVPEKDSCLRESLWRWARTELTRATSCDIASLNTLLEEAVSSTEGYYPVASHEVRLMMAKATALAISLDSNFLSPEAKEKLPHSQNRFWQGLEPEDVWSPVFFNFVGECAGLFGANNPLLGTLVSSGWSRWLDGCLLEEQLWGIVQNIGDKEGQALDTNFCPIEDFPYYLRTLTGAPISYCVPAFKPSREVEVPYSVWFSYAPALTTVINLGNDLFSYPKEVFDGEKVNYVSLVTQIKRASGCRSRFAEGSLWTFRDTICDLFQRLLQSCEVLEQAFKVPRQCNEADEISRYGSTSSDLNLANYLCHEFIHGYLGWHVNSPRYRLDSLRARLTSDASGEVQCNTTCI